MTEQGLIRTLGQAFNRPESTINRTIQLLDEGATIPFLSRYRKEVTGGMDEVELGNLKEKLTYLRDMEKRRLFILDTIREQGKLTAELEKRISACQDVNELEDLYLPTSPNEKRERLWLAKKA